MWPACYRRVVLDVGIITPHSEPIGQVRPFVLVAELEFLDKCRKLFIRRLEDLVYIGSKLTRELLDFTLDLFVCCSLVCKVCFFFGSA